MRGEREKDLQTRVSGDRKGDSREGERERERVKKEMRQVEKTL